MKYAVYFIWNDGFKDTFNVSNANDRDLNSKEMIKRNDFKSIEFCPIYKNGEYGKHKKVLQEDFSWNVLFENIKTGAFYHFDQILQGIKELYPDNPDDERLKNACSVAA